MNHPRPKIIAEIGCNHKGDFAVAKEMVMVAAQFCKVDVVKFQKRNPRELLTPEEYMAPHPNLAHAYGRTYGEHREKLEFTAKQHAKLKRWAEKWGVEYSTSVWDVTSANEIAALNPCIIKVPSACNLNWNLLSYICTHYHGEIHLSLGMTTRPEQEKIVRFFEAKRRSKSLVLYHCTSGYPVGFEDLCLLELERLRKKYGKRVKSFGFSGHHLGIAADIAAMTLGAQYIERHFTLDRTWKGTDNAASLEPDGLRRLSRDLRNVYLGLTEKPAGLLPVEEEQRKKLKRCV